jgi:2-haloacid dehalogenase
VFPDVGAALTEARERGWHLAVLSNTDRDLIDASMVTIGIAFQLAVVAGEIGSYKPAPRHWEVFREHAGVAAGAHVHVAQSLYHDIEPASELGIPTVWINRSGEPESDRPTLTLPDLARLPDALDKLAPA